MDKKKFFGYIKPIFGLCVFMLIIYGAYTPSQKAEIQKIVCIKFKSGTSAANIEHHMNEFAQLRREIPQMVAYSGGKTLSVTGKPEYDAMHYLTFRTEDDITTFQNHPKYQEFVKNNEAIWEKELVIDANIQK
ncbi:Dabb family protein [Runella sp.]|uniref:Dabb family protein n=1 Tax=Runella sp. TaxID=1960881 RepID=UPI003D0FFD24